MYTPRSFAEERPEVLWDQIDAHPFGALVTATSDGPFATHLPLLLDRSRGPFGVLEGHVARANPHYRLEGLGKALVIFQGRDAYVTPSWYPSKAEHGRVVPTWNYVAVHARGAVRFVEDPAWLRAHLERLTARHEAGRERPWAVDDAPAEYVAQQARAIVGVEVVVDRLEGKWKVSQNRSPADVDGVVRGLESAPDAAERAMADLVRARRPADRA